MKTKTALILSAVAIVLIGLGIAGGYAMRQSEQVCSLESQVLPRMCFEKRELTAIRDAMTPQERKEFREAVQAADEALARYDARHKK